MIRAPKVYGNPCGLLISQAKGQSILYACSTLWRADSYQLFIFLHDSMRNMEVRILKREEGTKNEFWRLGKPGIRKN